MNIDLETVRNAAFALDEASQGELAEDILEHLAESEQMAIWLKEAKERLDEHRRGEGSTVTAEEMFAKGRKIIEDAKRRRE